MIFKVFGTSSSLKKKHILTLIVEVYNYHKNILHTLILSFFFNDYKLMFTQVILSVCHVLLLSYLNETSFRKYCEKAFYTF
jgi:hypothetical protein